MNVKTIDREVLENLYLSLEKNPYEIGEILERDHKTVRSYLRKYEIPLRTSQEYNFLSKRSHSSPSTVLLHSPISVAAHTAYICEGWHTSKTNYLSFCNQDPALINLFCKCIESIYGYTSPIRVQISFDPDAESKSKVDEYLRIFENRNPYLSTDRTRKNPIAVVKVGGKNMAREFIANAYLLLSELG